MDFRTALVGVLFIIVISPLGTSQDVPDGVVYTELKKTLVRGSKGILTCRFKGTPNAVYWRKGSNPDTAPFVMSWGYGTKYGPRYEDGSCDINTNYSLVIKTVRDTDAGRYICRVSNYQGVLKHNHTDVTVTNTAVKTEPNVEVQMGEVGVLPCKVLIRPRKVSWVKGVNSTLVSMNPSGGVIDISGPGHEGWLFNMTKDYSLVINDVNLQHEDNYFCEVTEFDTGLVYRDLTALTVYAHPREPFPIIEGCPIEDPTNCIITTDSSITLTCHVDGYYPDINLFFMHGSKRVESIDTKTWNNTDGTRNRSTTISADKSKDAYKCIASGIPGLGNNDEVSASVRLIQEQHNSLILTVLLVPIVLCLMVALLTWMIRGKRSSKEEKYVKGHILYVELWKLVEYVIEKEETPKLVDVIASLDGDEESLADMDKEYYYQQLSRWKETCDKKINQRTKLFKKCRKASLHEILQKLEEFRLNTSAEISPSDFEHILWYVSEPLKMKKFLARLGMNVERESELNPKKQIVEEALRNLNEWKPSKLGFLNPVIIISSAMEMLGYCTVDNNFFQIPPEEKDKIHDHEVQRTERNLMTSHWKKVKSIMKPSEGGIQTKDPNENDEVLFSVQKMLRDWLEDVECSNYDKRRTLKRLSDGLPDENESRANGQWPSDDELKFIARYLNSASVRFVCDKLHITSPHEDADENQRFEALCQLRKSTSEREWTSVYSQLRSVLEGAGIPGLMPPMIDDPISKAECVDIAFDLLMTDVFPVAKALRVSVDKLPAYRPVFKPHHLKKGTIGVIAHLVESTKEDDSRLVLCRRLREAGFPLATAWNVLVKQLGYGELYAISDAMRKDVSRHDIYDDDMQPHEEREELLADNKIPMIEMKVFVGESQEEGNRERGHYCELIKMLKLTEEELAVLPSHHDVFTLFTTWKARPNLALFNRRAAIISGLLDIQRPDIATSVAEGKYFVREVSLQFITYIVKKMDENDRGRFAEAFNLQKEFEGAHGSDDEISKIIHGFLRKWESKSKLLVVGKKDGVPLIDKLVDNGFLDIARELNAIHYQNYLLEQEPRNCKHERKSHIFN